MRKSEPDSKYFGEILENAVFPVKTYQNHSKTMQIIYCVVSYYKELTDRVIREYHWFFWGIPTLREDFVKLRTSNDLGFFPPTRLECIFTESNAFLIRLL